MSDRIDIADIRERALAITRGDPTIHALSSTTLFALVDAVQAARRLSRLTRTYGSREFAIAEADLDAALTRFDFGDGS